MLSLSKTDDLVQGNFNLLLKSGLSIFHLNKNGRKQKTNKIHFISQNAIWFNKINFLERIVILVESTETRWLKILPNKTDNHPCHFVQFSNFAHVSSDVCSGCQEFRVHRFDKNKKKFTFHRFGPNSLRNGDAALMWDLLIVSLTRRSSSFV